MAEITLVTDATIGSDESIDVTVHEATDADAASDTFTDIYQSPSTNSHQGYTTDGTYHYTFDTTHIYKWDDAWSLVAENASPLTNLPSELNHLGDPQHYNGEIHTAVTYWNGDSDNSSPHIAVYDASDLSYIGHYSLGNGITGGAAGVGIDTATETAWICDYTDGSVLYQYDLPDYTNGTTLSLGTTIPDAQGVYYRDEDEYLYVSNDLDDQTHVVDSATGETLNTVAPISNATYEGLDYSQGSLRVLEDPGGSEGIIHIFNQDVSAANSVTQTIADGQNSYTLSGFDGSSGNLVWVETALSGDGSSTPTLNSIEVTP